LSREALRRAKNVWVDPTVAGAVTKALSGSVVAISGRSDRRAAIVMSLYWYGLAGKGAHLLSYDEMHARDMQKFFSPVGALLGCNAELVSPSKADNSRRSAYSATITFGSYSDMAVDYLRDNLHYSRLETVQRELYAGVLDELDMGIAERALSTVYISAPRKDPLRGASRIEEVAATFRQDSDYRLYRKQQAIVFSKPAIKRLKSAVGWEHPPSLRAVSMAERIERAIVSRERIRPNDRETLAEVTIQGYLRAYERLAGFSASERVREVLVPVLWDGDKEKPDLSELPFERRIDQQRTKTYAWRLSIRDNSDVLIFVQPIIAEAVDTWLADGPESLTAGLCDALAGHDSPKRVDGILTMAKSQADLAKLGQRFVNEAVDRRKEELGAARMSDLLREVLLSVIDLQWRDHICRIRFIQRQSTALYQAAADVDAARHADIDHLFADCEQTIRVEAIKYLLNIRP
jgi:preprotein translocase subunit SecA